MKHLMSIFLNDQLQCQVEREDHFNGYPVYNGCLFCPECTKIWARLIWNEAPPFGYLVEPRSIPCEAHPTACHPDLRPVAGSLLDNPTINGYDVPLLNALPEFLILREFLLHMKSLLAQETA
jgi:hypothetical protein